MNGYELTAIGFVCLAAVLICESIIGYFHWKSIGDMSAEECEAFLEDNS